MTDFFDDNRTVEMQVPYTPPPSTGVFIDPGPTVCATPAQLDGTLKAPLPLEPEDGLNFTKPPRRWSWTWFIRGLVALDVSLMLGLVLVMYRNAEEQPRPAYVGAGTITTLEVPTTLPPLTTTPTTVHQATTSRLTTTTVQVSTLAQTTMCRP